MRELKFRAWSTKRGQWHYFTLSTLAMGSAGREGDGVLHYENWCQYIGLKDKNGIEIYEWDILRGPGYDDAGTLTHHFYVVRFGESSDIRWGFYIEHYSAASTTEAFQERLEVAGNIYETPELLKGTT